MTEQDDQGDGAALPTAPVVHDQAPTGAADPVNLEEAVAKAARNAEREAQKRVSLDDIKDPEARKLAERLNSQVITEYRKKLEEGKDDKFVSTAQVEAMLRKDRQLARAEAEAKERYWETMGELELKKGTDDYAKFESAAKFLDKSQLSNKEALELVARAVGVGKFRPTTEIPAGGVPFLPSGGIALRSDAQGRTTTTGDEDMDRTLAEYHRSMSRKR